MTRHLARPIHTRGLVLRRVDYSESSQIVTVDTKDHGIIDLIAKGSRRVARRSSAFPTPLDLAGWYDLVYRPRREGLHLATEASLIEGFPQLRGSIGSWLEACFVLDLLRSAFTDGDPHPELLRAALSTLKVLGVGPGRIALRNRFVIELLHASGVTPGWDRCAVCREPIGVGEASWHLPAALHCRKCRSSGDRPVPVEILGYLRAEARLPRGNLPTADFPGPVLERAWESLRDALLHHLERAPRSLRYLRAESSGGHGPAGSSGITGAAGKDLPCPPAAPTSRS